MSDVLTALVSDNQETRRRLERLEHTETMSRAANDAAWAQAVSAWLNIPGLRFLSNNTFDSNGDIVDLTPLGATMNANGTPIFSQDATYPLQSYVYLNGGTDYFLASADSANHDILGTETYVASGFKGMTMGIWYEPLTISAFNVLFSKWGAANATKAYLLAATAGNEAMFRISDGAGSNTEVSTTGGSVTASSGWHFICGRFDPSTEMKVWRNRETNTNTTSIPAAIINSATALAIGAQGNAANIVEEGNIGLAFLSAQYLADEVVRAIYEVSRGLYKPTDEF